MSPSNAAVGLTRAVRGMSEPGEPYKYAPSGTRTFARIAPTDLHAARALADYGRQLGLRRLVLVHDGELYGSGLQRKLREQLPKLGITVVARARVSRKRAPRVARKLRRVDADGMVMTGLAEHGVSRLWERVSRDHPRWKLIGSDGVTLDSFAARLSRNAAARTFMTAVPLAAQAYPFAGQAFHARFAAEQGRPAEPWAIFGYEAMAVALDAISRAVDPTDRQDVIDAFFATRNRQSLLGMYSIDRFGDSTLGTYGGYRIDATGAIVWDRVLDTTP